MPSVFKKGLVAAALATALVGISATAVAQGMGGMPHGMHAQPMDQAQAQKGQSNMNQRHAQRMERMQKYHADRQAKLKAELKLTAAQEPAWNAYVQRTAPMPRPMQAAAQPDGPQLTTPQRLDQIQALKAERDAQMAQRIEATKSLYAALTPEQQKLFDKQAHNGMHRASMKGEHHKGGKGGKDGKGGHHGMHGEHSGMGGMGCEGGMQKQS